MTVGCADCAVIAVLDILLSANSSRLSSTGIYRELSLLVNSL